MAKAPKKSVKKSAKKSISKTSAKSPKKSAVKARPKTQLKTQLKNQAKPAKKAAPKNKVKATAKLSKKMASKPAPKAKTKTTPKLTSRTTPVKAASRKPTPSRNALAPQATPNLRPLFHRILIRPQARAEKTAGGLYIPTTVEDKPLQGEVLAVGHGKRSKKGVLRPLQVQAGETVLYAQYAGTDVEFSGEKFLILTEDEILGVVG